MEDLSRAIEDQKMLLNHLARLGQKFDGKPNDVKTRGLVQSFLDEIEGTYKQFKDNHDQIYDHIRDQSIPFDDVPYLKNDIHYDFYDSYLTLKGKLLDVLAEFKIPYSPTIHSSTFNALPSLRNESVCAEVKLPKIDIPIFSGNYLEWVSYRDLFTSLVHNNTVLSKVQKYYYLRSSCKDTPLSIVNEYPASETSYDLAWSALNERYHNKRKIVDHLLQKLFSIPVSDGSCENIKQILDITRNCIALLRTLEINCDNWDAILIHITVGKLDVQTCKEWEQSLKGSKEIPNIKDLFVFLETTFRTLESIDDHVLPRPDTLNRSSKFYKRPQQPRVNITAISDENCPCCEKRHLLYKCFKFAALSSAAKKDLIFSKRLCKNCLHSGHYANDCRLQSFCHICQQRHHTIIHNEFHGTTANLHEINDQGQQSTSSEHAPNSLNINCNLSMINIKKIPQVLLATARVTIETENGNFSLRALLDQGAQATLITENAVQTLKLRKHNTFARIYGISGKTTTTKKYVNFSISSAYKNNFKLHSSAYVLPFLTNYGPRPINKSTLPNLDELFLADPNFDSSEKIDLLIGGDIYGDIMEPNHKKIDNGIFLQLSKFGWVVSGPTSKISYNCDVSIHTFSLDKQLRAFWEQEELIEQRQLTLEENSCEEHFITSHSRDLDGRYTVDLPFVSELVGGAPPIFEHTDFNALKRLKHMEQRFVRDPKLETEYRKFMTEYENLGHMVKVGSYPQSLHPQGYFFPHQGVLRESSSTTNFRVVFDGSSKRSPHTSLNEELSVGPALQNDLPTIITRWRRFKIGFRSDLEKMFRQIRVNENQQHYQQILWRNSTNSDISIYRLQTVTYGTTSAPYLSIRVLHQLADDEKNTFPIACDVLRRDTYVDDVISGADTIDDAIYLQKQLVELLAAGGFNLRKWTSNSVELMSNIPDNYKEKVNTVEFDEQNVVKALGLEWRTTDDAFSFKVNFDIQDKLTKSSLLSDAAKLYDPLGWLSPVTINAKVMFQKLWLEGIDWKDLVPTNISSEWNQYITQLKNLEEIRIPRWIGSFKNSKLELHGFCDSSQSAYAAAVYVKVLDGGRGLSRVSLIQSKTKVSPLKKLTIPKLELCGASLLVKLMKKIETQLDRKITNIYYWTDSMTVLGWIRGESSKWTVFVGNRVAEIQRFSNNSQWRYIASQSNTADCASRGITALELLNHELWWSGPSWLSQSPTLWPKQPDEPYNTNSELRKSFVTINTIKTVQYPDILTKFSSLNKLIRVTAYVLRFGTKKENRETGFLKTYELNRALRSLVKLSQVEFEDEIKLLQNKKYISNKSNILSLCPFLDEYGVLRVGGRIHKAKFNYDLKHPILLSKNNPLSVLIFLDAHAKTLHGGLIQMQAYVSRTFWILSARNLAKRVQRRCITCFKYKAKAAQQIMGDLPAVRLQPSRPFKNSGVDYAGPITIKQSTARNSVTTKGYICLFICMVTKAIHLEGVTTLSSDSFVAAFRRFTARRGMCTDLYSDCGTNFVGANKDLQVLNRRSRASLPEELVEQLANTGTSWHFIPPASPHFGGLWEAGVKSTKHHLRRIMEKRILTYEELCTLLAQIECCLNSRPLCPLSSDPTDCQALTPSHFLIGEPTLCIPDENLLECNIDRLTRWKVVERLKQQFWKRWIREYLNRLQSRPKWLKQHKNAEIGDLVLIIDERVPPGQWPLARISDINPGEDGLVRVLQLLSNGKTYKRNVSKIAFLPVNDHANSIIE